MLVHERLWSNYFNSTEEKFNISDIFGNSCDTELADVHSAKSKQKRAFGRVFHVCLVICPEQFLACSIR